MPTAVAPAYPHFPRSGVSIPMSRTVPFDVTTVSPSIQRTTFADPHDVPAACASPAPTPTTSSIPLAATASALDHVRVLDFMSFS